MLLSLLVAQACFDLVGVLKDTSISPYSVPAIYEVPPKRYLYTTGYKTLLVFDVSDPSRPYKLREIRLDSLDEYFSLYSPLVLDTFLYVFAHLWGKYRILTFKLTPSPAKPELLSISDTNERAKPKPEEPPKFGESSQSPWFYVPQTKTLYFSKREGGLYIFSRDDPANPKFLGTWNPEYWDAYSCGAYHRVYYPYFYTYYCIEESDSPGYREVLFGIYDITQRYPRFVSTIVVHFGWGGVDEIELIKTPDGRKLLVDRKRMFDVTDPLNVTWDTADIFEGGWYAPVALTHNPSFSRIYGISRRPTGYAVYPAVFVIEASDSLPEMVCYTLSPGKEKSFSKILYYKGLVYVTGVMERPEGDTPFIYILKPPLENPDTSPPVLAKVTPRASLRGKKLLIWFPESLDVDLGMFSVDGREVWRKRVNLKRGLTIVYVDKDLEAGLYLLKAGYRVFKIVKED